MDGAIRERTSPCLQTVLHWSFLHFTLIAFSGVLGFTRVDTSMNIPCGNWGSYAIRMVAFSILPHAGFGQNDHRKKIPHIEVLNLYYSSNINNFGTELLNNPNLSPQSFQSITSSLLARLNSKASILSKSTHGNSIYTLSNYKRVLKTIFCQNINKIPQKSILQIFFLFRLHMNSFINPGGLFDLSKMPKIQNWFFVIQTVTRRIIWISETGSS